MTLLLRIDRYLRAEKMSRSTFGRRAVGDPRLVGDLMRGRVVGPRVTARIERFMEGMQA